METATKTHIDEALTREKELRRLRAELDIAEENAQILKGKIYLLEKNDVIFKKEVGYKSLTIEKKGEGFEISMTSTSDFVRLDCDYDFMKSLIFSLLRV